ncbi:hypothetical protein RP20_CCG014256 [Aedes albopictus]|nr:hypothetical protein RP20_CCG014256 [Aedes albopictus]
MKVILIRRLDGQHEGLRDTVQRLVIVGQLAGHLNNHAIADGRLRIHLANLGMTIAKVLLLDPVMDLFLADHQCAFVSKPPWKKLDELLMMKSAAIYSICVPKLSTIEKEDVVSKAAESEPQKKQL